MLPQQTTLISTAYCLLQKECHPKELLNLRAFLQTKEMECHPKELGARTQCTCPREEVERHSKEEGILTRPSVEELDCHPKELQNLRGDGMPSSSQVCCHSVNKFTPISPTKCRSADEVIGLYSQYKNSKEIGRLAIALAKYTYFGNTVLSRSTVTGRGNKAALDPSALQGNIRAIFPDKHDDQFEDIWIRCKESIANACKSLQYGQ